MRNLLILLLIISSVAVLVGVLAKVKHWPGANILLGAGMVTELLCAVLLVLYFWNMRRKA